MPSNTVVTVYNDLIGPSHKVTRGSIGISVQGRAFGAASIASTASRMAFWCRKFSQDGPADKAGLKAGDIITSVDGRSIKDGDDLVNDIASRRPGSTIRLGTFATASRWIPR